MKTHLTKLQTMLIGLIEKAKVSKGLLSILGIFFVLQVYLVRELVAAELLFVLGFAVLMVLGSPGGSRITTAVYQVISNVIDHHLPLALAVAAPRLHDQALPDMVYVERGGFATASTDSLVAMGHQVTVWGYKTEVNAIERTATGWVGVADPRRAGAAAGY